MWLTDLAKVARRTGYPVVERKGWKRRGRAPMSGVKSIICHHTAGGARGNAPSLGVVQNGRPGLPGPLAQIVLGRDGTIYIVAAGRCNHAGRVGSRANSNSYAIGIEAENTGREKWPARQMDAYAKLCRALADHYKVPISQVRGHKEVAVPRGRKPDPSFNMNEFRNMVRNRKGTAPAGGSTSSSGSGKKYREVKYGDMLRLYTFGAPVKEWQEKALGYEGKAADGYFGPDTERDTKALQRRFGVQDDGVVGPKTWPLRNKVTSKPAAKPAAKTTSSPKKGKPFPLPEGHFYYTEDRRKTVHSGYWKKDRPAIREIQKKVGAGVDGGYGARTKAAVQRWQEKNGLKDDGAVGPATWSKMFG